jgi:hypothetical protein
VIVFITPILSRLRLFAYVAPARTLTFIVGKMIQLTPTKWFYWLIDNRTDHTGDVINAKAFASSSKQGIAVDFFDSSFDPGFELRSIRWLIAPKDRPRYLQKHRQWLIRMKNDSQLDAYIHNKATLLNSSE